MHVYRVSQKSCSLFQVVVAQWCNPLTSQPQQSRGVGSISGRATPLERHDDKGLGTLISA